jgi:hypothetical protein
VRWPYDKRADATHAWGALGVGTAMLIGIPTVLATIHATDPHFRWWWPTTWMMLPLVIIAIGLVLLLAPVRRSGVERPALHPQDVPRPADRTDTRPSVLTPKTPGRVAGHTDMVKDRMIYDILLNPAKDLLVRYIYRTADITMISSQAGLDQGSIAAGGSAVNFWQEVLERACIEGTFKVDALLDCALHHLSRTVAEAPLRAAVEEYRQARS